MGAAILAYLTAFPGAFLSDAGAAIARNWALRGSTEWLAWFGRDFYWGTLLQDVTLYRPLTILSFLVQIRTSGVVAWAFVAVNVLLHAGVSLLLFRLGVRLVGAPGAWVGALLFAVHPVHVEAVAWIMGRSELLAAGFALAAGLWALRAVDPSARHPERFAIGAGAAYLAAVLSKEHVVLLPAWMLLPWALRARATRAWRPPRAVIWLAAAAATALAVFVVLRASALTRPVERDLEIDRLYNPTSGEPAPLRWLTAAAVVWRYAGLLLWPAQLSHIYGYAEIPVSRGLGPAEAGGLVVIAALLTATIVAAWRVPALGVALSLVPITFFPVSNFPFRIGTIMAERLLYLPSAGLCLGAGWLLARMGALAPLERSSLWPEPARPRLAGARGLAAQRRPEWRRLAATGALGVALVALAGRTLAANLDWQSAGARARADFAAAPRAVHARLTLAWEEAQRGEMERAVELAESALRVAPRNPMALGTLGDIHLRRGDAGTAVRYYDQALALAPGHVPFRAWRGRALKQAGRIEEAERDLRESVRVAPYLPEARLQLGSLLLETGRPAEAREHLDVAARLEPDEPLAFVGLAVAAQRLGDVRAAVRYGRAAERRGISLPDSFWVQVGVTRDEALGERRRSGARRW